MKKIFWALALCLTMLFSSTVFAEDIDARQALREAMTANAGEDNRVFHQDVLFFVPTFQGELEIFGATENNSFKSSGELNFWATMDNGNSTVLTIPFYLVQTAKDMKIYFETDKKWYQFQSPSVAAAVTDMVATPTDEELEEMIAQAKDVKVLRDTDTQRTLLVTVDGNKLADDMKVTAENNPADNGTADDKILQDKFFQYLDTAFRNADIWYTWTVSKVDGKTITLGVHLSSLVQEFARAVLDDKDQVLDNNLRDTLEIVAYYSEAKSYTTFLNSDAKKLLEIPKKVLKAKPVDNLSDAK